MFEDAPGRHDVEPEDELPEDRLAIEEDVDEVIEDEYDDEEEL